MTRLDPLFMTRLDPLFMKYGTDKGTNGYTGLYECLFAPRRQRVGALLEIGIGTMLPGVSSSMKGYMPDSYQPGSSLRAWRDYFPQAMVYGLDIQPDTQFTDHRIRTGLCDSTDLTQVLAALERLPAHAFDIIIDDGCHDPRVQIATFANFFTYVMPGGLYVLEDIWPHLVAEIVEGTKTVRGDHPFFVAGPKLNQFVVQKL